MGNDETLMMNDGLRALAAELDAMAGNGSGFPESTIPSFPLIDFQLLAPLGRGGMGTVYRARQQSLNRLVAIKILDDTLGRNPEQRDRFIQESRTVASLHHPNIVHVYSAGQSNGHCYFAMELVNGHTSDSHTFASIRELAIFARHSAEALAYAHRCGVIHRDVKPSNILIGDDGTVKLSDFGLSCLADNSSPDNSGTRRFMAPERLDGATATQASDQYALGVTLLDLAANNLRKSAQPDADFSAILDKATAQNPADRYADMDDFLADVHRFLACEPVAARRTPPLRRMALFAKRNPLAAASIAVAGICMAGFISALAVGYARTRNALNATRQEAAQAAQALATALTAIERGETDPRDAELSRALTLAESLAERFPEDETIKNAVETLRDARDRHAVFPIRPPLRRKSRRTP